MTAARSSAPARSTGKSRTRVRRTGRVDRPGGIGDLHLDVPLALATDARLRGTELLLNARVDGATSKKTRTVLHTTAGDVQAR